MLRITNLETVYNDVVLALKGISLEVPAGRIVALLGANGAGKTTTINTISGIRKTINLAIEDGSVEFDGESINDREPYEIVSRGILQVPEGRRVFAETRGLAAGHGCLGYRAAPPGTSLCGHGLSPTV